MKHATGKKLPVADKNPVRFPESYPKKGEK